MSYLANLFLTIKAYEYFIGMSVMALIIGIENGLEKGLTEEEALMNAWMARLLRKDEYNIKRKELTYLWMPAHYPPAEKRKYSQVVRSVTGTLDEDDSALSPQPHFSPSPNVTKTEPTTTATTTG